MRIHLVNPSDVSFGVGVITPRWLYVLAGATPRRYGDPLITDETLRPFDADRVQPSDIVGIGIHTSNARRGYELGRLVHERGGIPVYGGIHASIFPEEPRTYGNAAAVVRGDGDKVWADVLSDYIRGSIQPLYEGGTIAASDFASARWELMPQGSYMWASVQTVRGCPKHCSFCSVWRTDGRMPRQRPVQAVIEEAVTLRRMGYRFIALADDNFYTVSLEDLERAARRSDKSHYHRLLSLRQERFQLMDMLSKIDSNIIYFTQITMEAAEDEAFLHAMRRAGIKGALVGIESVSDEGLSSTFKSFNATGENLVAKLQKFRSFDIHVLGSFIFGLQSDTPETFSATADLADRAGLTFAQFVPLTPLPGTIDFEKWQKGMIEQNVRIDGIPIHNHWLIPDGRRPKIYIPHPVMNADEILRRTQHVWDSFYGISKIWNRSRCVSKIRNRLAFVFISKLYRQMYARTGISTDSARKSNAVKWTRFIGKLCRPLFSAPALPELQVPTD
ncbi:MAG: B12-binding domain-containing radical SAM protein [Acidobacteria bacterium]|nr:B12-binding domain-containing radical SAM protein [Acidobacteriota bacterium]